MAVASRSLELSVEEVLCAPSPLRRRLAPFAPPVLDPEAMRSRRVGEAGEVAEWVDESDDARVGDRGS